MVSATKSNVVPLKATVGSLIDAMSVVRDQRRTLNEQDKTLKEKYDELEVQLMATLDSQDTRKGEGKKASASISESEIPVVKNWDAFYAYIFKNKYTHLLQRRPATEGCRELFELKGSIPGVDKFTKRTVNLRDL